MTGYCHRCGKRVTWLWGSRVTWGWVPYYVFNTRFAVPVHHACLRQYYGEVA